MKERGSGSVGLRAIVLRNGWMDNAVGLELSEDGGNQEAACDAEQDGADRLEKCVLDRDGVVHAEKEILGVTHAEIGGYFLDMWDLPAPLVEVALLHHSDEEIRPAHRDVLAAMKYADKLVNQIWLSSRHGAVDISDLYLPGISADDIDGIARKMEKTCRETIQNKY